MPPRLPNRADFPPSLTLSIVPPRDDKRPASVLLLLHGLGDTHDSFTNLARQLNLPETVCISLQAPTPLPFDIGGFHWGDDIVFDQASGQMDVDTGFEKASKMIGQVVIDEYLVRKCGFARREVVLFGFGQGGMAAMGAAAMPNSGELGGVVSIGGPVPMGSTRNGGATNNATPMLVLHGSTKSLITTTAVRNITSTFSNVEVHEWKRPGDGMPTNRNEMLPIMQFFARRLRSRTGVPEGAQEIG